MPEIEARIRAAWEGRISGCQLGKAVEIVSASQGADALHAYLDEAKALPIRDYVPAIEGSLPDKLVRGSCRGHITRSEPDDDINYTVLALLLLEEHGLALTTNDVAAAWLRLLPAGATFTAERAAYLTILERAPDFFGSTFTKGMPAGFDLEACADNEYNDWIGAQIRADLYGWVCPGRPALAADLATRDAALSHRGDGIYGAAFVAALGAAIPDSPHMTAAVERALREIPAESGAAAAVALGRDLAGDPSGGKAIRDRYEGLSPVHTLNNLALVVWALLGSSDYSSAIGDVVAAGLDTDCNGATVGGLWGLRGDTIPEHWTAPWQGRVATSLSGLSEIPLDDLVRRTVAVAHAIERDEADATTGER